MELRVFIYIVFNLVVSTYCVNKGLRGGALPTDSPDCPFSDGGERFKAYNMRACFADCLELDGDDDQCRYNPESLNRGNCSTSKFIPNLKSNKKVFCGFDSVWSFKEEYSSIDENATSKWITASNFCTHILIYPLIKFDDRAMKFTVLDDYYKRFLPHIAEFKRAKLKVLLVIGNFLDNPVLTISPKALSSIARNPSARDLLVKEAVEFVQKSNLDGIHLRWTYPGSPLSVPEGGEGDKLNYVLFLRKFSTSLRPNGLLLTTEGSVSKPVITRGIDIPQVMPLVDFYLVYATDYHGNWMMSTGLSTPNKEVRQSMEQIQAVVDNPSKLILGFRFGCGVFELVKANPQAGRGTFANNDKKVDWSWFTLMKKVFVTEKERWVVKRGNNETQSYTCNGDQWVSFDDINDIRTRIGIINGLGLGGAHVQSALDDDIANELGCGESPYLRTINEMLRGYDDCILPTCP